jgi:hypothetical protein
LGVQPVADGKLFSLRGQEIFRFLVASRWLGLHMSPPEKAPQMVRGRIANDANGPIIIDCILLNQRYFPSDSEVARPLDTQTSK